MDYIKPNYYDIMIAVVDRTVKIWDIVSGKLKYTLEGHSGSVTSVAISYDGLTVVSGSCK